MRNGKTNLRGIDFRDITTIGPAGSINASAREMAQWVKLHLGKGKLGDKQVMSESSMRQMHTPQMAITVASRCGMRCMQ